MYKTARLVPDGLILTIMRQKGSSEMQNFNHRRDCGKRISNQFEFRHSTGARLLVLFLCLSMLAGFLPSQTAAADGEQLMLADFVTFGCDPSIVYTGGESDGKEVANEDLIVKGQALRLGYAYTISTEQCRDIRPDTSYYLDVSRHLQLPDLGSNGEKLCMTVEDETGAKKEVQFGTLHADGGQAWVVFCAAENAAENNAQTVISEQGGLEDAYFYLDCMRAEKVPEGEFPIKGSDNRYVMKLESRELSFGYAEHEPVSAKAEITKKGVLEGKTITWSITYTPWQNPVADAGVTSDTAFELRDTLSAGWNKEVLPDIRIDGAGVTIYSSRDVIPNDAETYALIDKMENGDTTLIIGGTKLQAGKATQGTQAVPLEITYQTMIRDELLLPGGSTDKIVTNTVALFAAVENGFRDVGICASGTVGIPQPEWIKKTGVTRRSSGQGSTTDWTVTFDPNGFKFTEVNELTFHDQFPESSALVDGSVKIHVGKDRELSATIKKDCSDCVFTASQIETDSQTVTITYQTKVEEATYEKGEDLGSNTAWFTFKYAGTDYKIPKVISPVSSGSGAGSGTERIEKTASGYDACTRTIDWTVTINPHKANLKGGTFTDDLKVGPACLLQGSGHTSGLELVDDIQVQVDGAALLEADKDKVTLKYDNRTITVQVGEIGAKTITLQYKTRVCDPCIFANNTQKTPFQNMISTKDMKIGSNAPCSADASATADVSATVLTKKAPVYDYKTGIMTWTVEVDAAGLPMTDVVLTDELPAGLSYVDQSLKTSPAISGISASSVGGRELTINLGKVSETTTVTFQTRADAQTLGFGGDQLVTVENTIRMNGKADGVEFQPVSHTVSQKFANHGLVKTSSADVKNGWIRYEVLINPYGLALPAQPMIVDTLDRRLQLDTDTLCFYSATLDGTTAGQGQTPGYTKKTDTETKLQISACDPAANSFTVHLPINAGDRGAYVLAYTADIIQQEKGVYNNSVRFEGGVTMKLGGTKNNETTVSGGGGGGGGAVSRKATISIEKKDEETGSPLAGVTFTLYQWDASGSKRGIAFAQGTTGADGRLFFRVKPGAAYELVETMPVTGYSKVFTCANLQSLSGVTKTQDGLLILAGAATSELKLDLTNKHLTGGSGSGGSSGGGGSSENGGGFGGGGTDPGTSDTPDDPDKTDGSNKKEDPDDLDEKDDFGKKDNTNTKDKPDKGKKPNKTNKSPKSDKSDKSDRKDKTDQKSTSGKSGQSGSSVNAGASDQTSASGKKGLSGQTGSSVNTGTSKQSSASGKTGFSGQTSSSNDSGASDRTDSSGDPDIPQTGDNTPWLAAVVLLSGILLVVMSCYQLFRLKKREKR